MNFTNFVFLWAEIGYLYSKDCTMCIMKVFFMVSQLMAENFQPGFFKKQVFIDLLFIETNPQDIRFRGFFICYFEQGELK